MAAEWSGLASIVVAIMLVVRPRAGIAAISWVIGVSAIHATI